MIDVSGLQLTTLARLIQTGQHSSAEVTRAYLDRIERFNPRLNAYLKVFEEEAMEEAAAADREIAQGNVRGPLHGVPIAVKDIIDIEGHVTTAGGKILPEVPAAEDAAVIARLRAAGAVLLGKLNLHEFAWGGTTDNPHYGPCYNPWKEGYSPGGSSGGSGAAVAAGLCAAALGTDTLGSVRIPASYCGTVGIKPTNGLVSNRGVFPLSWSLDCVGPLAGSVADAAIVLGAMAGPDSGDPNSALREPGELGPSEDSSLQGVRLGVLGAQSEAPEREREVAEAVAAATQKLTSLGAERVQIDAPDVRGAYRAAINITLADAAAIHRENLESHGEDIGSGVRALLRAGAGLPGPIVADAHRARVVLRRSFAEVMDKVDVLISPTTPMAAHEFETRGERSIARFTAPMNLLGYPAVSVPCGFTGDGLPIGLQIAAAPFAEAMAIRVAAAYETATEWDERRPEGFETEGRQS